MYVRIARFEGVDPGQIDDQIAELRRQMEASRHELPPDAPAAIGVLMETVVRFVQLVDRDNGTLLGLSYCETEDDLRRANEALDSMSPPAASGKRTTVETYEVAIDESFA
jgi:hypothetical protein